MPRYVTFFSFNPDALNRFVEHPEDRAAEVRRLIEVAGGRLEAYYWMFGPHDGFLIIDMPEADAAAAAVLTSARTGAFRHLETHELIEAERLERIAERAQRLRGDYRAPGEASS